MEEFVNFLFKNITSIASALLIAFITARLNAYLNSRNNAKDRHAKACAAFRSAINTALEGLYPFPVAWPDNATAINHILRNRFPAIQVAVFEFRPFVSCYKKQKFDRAWHRYRNAYEEDQSVECYHHYENFDDNPHPKTVFKSKVDCLLSFAKDT